MASEEKRYKDALGRKKSNRHLDTMAKCKVNGDKKYNSLGKKTIPFQEFILFIN